MEDANKVIDGLFNYDEVKSQDSVIGKLIELKKIIEEHKREIASLRARLYFCEKERK